MTESTLDTLTRRLETLERDNRFLKIIAGVVLLGLSALALMGQSSEDPRKPILPEMLKGRVIADTIIAKQIHLMDDKGMLRVLLWPGQLSLHDEAGRVLASLAIIRGDATLMLTWKDMRSGASLTMINGEIPVLAMTDKAGRPRATLFLGESDDSTGFYLHGPDGSARVQAIVPTSGSAVLRLKRKDGKIA